MPQSHRRWEPRRADERSVWGCREGSGTVSVAWRVRAGRLGSGEARERGGWGAPGGEARWRAKTESAHAGQERYMHAGGEDEGAHVIGHDQRQRRG